MERFTTLRAAAVPFARDNIDTDQILPARFLHMPRDGDHGACLFRDLRYAADGTEVPDFPLNRDGWRDARIAIGGRNFACGSSRENAVWALQGAGIRAVIAPSFGDIFAINAVKNGILPVVLPAEAVASLIAEAEARPGAEITVDLAAQTVTGADGTVHPFEIDPFTRHCLLEGVDELAFTLAHEDDIAAFERRIGRENS
ncbi:3-isopropylmalate dehydratase small subunit [Roseomonas sp. PWR1]|uniref:3-isopropylmalate dehydratase small subunit n=1 Tax=Roseomonas nitratireducens TaxID=2820810 RepID=A0ABS4AX88_9PROT|nr:3-isopropylmalate dehydratase small subunit [Neoroseomonas nitratireducens]MBP0465371.1 3-isopropylmalate dehydratase small subunit [Neoroseomonas nitratireducens]